MKKLFLGLLLCSSVCSFAGNGSSGGGHIYGDQLNPWFLQNTQFVNYCCKMMAKTGQGNDNENRPKITAKIVRHCVA